LFREDLYYRINVVKLILPPLRERKEDIPLLVEHFIQRFNSLRGKEIQGPASEVMSVLMSYDFPGNIRELENIIEYATVVCKNHLIGIEHLPETLHRHPKSARITAPPEEKAIESSFDDMEKSFIYEALKKNNWNRTLTAAQMGIHPTTLWRKIKRFNLNIPNQNGRTKK
jgi:transcriptional regulator with PAS, ATPase and Fis domain